MADSSRPASATTAPTIRTLGRGLAALEAVAEAEDGIGVIEVAAVVGVDKGTASRLLASLREAGYVRQRADRRFELGSKVGWLARRYGTWDDELVQVAEPYLEKLRDVTQETVHLAVVEGTEVSFLAQLVPDRSVRVQSAVGVRLALHRTAMGRAVVASLSGSARERTLDAVRRVAAATQDEAAVAEFTTDVAAAEERGWAAIDRHDEVTRLAAVVRGAKGEPIAAIALSGPTYRMEKELDCNSRRIVETADAISAALDDHAHSATGGRRPRSLEPSSEFDAAGA